MKRMQSYEDYCRAMTAGGGARDKAILMGYLRSRLIDIDMQVQENGGYIGLDSFDPLRSSACRYDALSRVLLDSREAIVRLTDNLRTKIVRENEMTPIHRVREIDSAGISWICRRPGRDLREKLSGTRSVMAVHRHMSLDTGENRLLLAFVNAAETFICLKQECAAGAISVETETDFQGCLARFRVIGEVDEIRRWENTPPNNTLLSDRYYGRVWKAWNELNNLDNLTATDYDSLDSHIAVILYCDILAELRKRVCFPQSPVLSDYETFSVHVDVEGTADGGLEGLDAEGNPLIYRMTGAGLAIDYRGNLLTAQVEDGVCILTLTKSGKVFESKKIVLAPDNFTRTPNEILWPLGLQSVLPLRKHRQIERCKYAVLCLTEPFPLVLRENNSAPDRLQYLLAVQRQKNTFGLSLADARAVRLDESRTISTIRTSLRKADKSSSRMLTGLLRAQLDAQRLVFLFPDIYNEFELSAMRGELRVHYRQLDAFPESIAAIFSLLKDGQWDQRFLQGGFVITVKLEGRQLSITLLQSVPEPNLEQHGGIVWERHPTVVYDCSEKLSGLYNELDRRGLEGRAKELLDTFGLSALPKILERLALYDSGWGSKWFALSTDAAELIRRFPLNINTEIDQFKRSFAGILKGKTPLAMMLTPSLLYTANRFAVYRRETDVLLGYNNYCILAAGTEQSLWRDHLPKLAIKRFIGSFDLVENATILPMYHKIQQIDIDNTFTLAAGKQSYRFQLIQGGFGDELPFTAVVTHKAFPLRTDTECRLRLTYTYGSDDPYDLVFVPVHPAQAGFREVGVEWIQMEEHPWRDLPCPPFPEKPTWDELAAHSTKYGIANFPEQATTRIEELLEKQQQRRVHIPISVSALDWEKQARSGQKPGPLFLCQWCNHVLVDGEPATIYLNTRWFDDWNNARNDFDGFTCLLEESAPNEKLVTMALSDCAARWVPGKNGDRCLLHRMEGGEKQLITIFKRNFVDDSVSSKLDTLSFALVPTTDKFRMATTASYDNILENRIGKYFYMYVELPEIGKVQVSFFESSFLFDRDFPPAKGDTLSFTWREKNSKIYINNIVVGKCATYEGKPRQYTAKYVRIDDKPSYGPFLDRGLLFPLHQVFSNGRMLTELSCPDGLRSAVLKLTRFMLSHYDECAGERTGHVMFTALSLLATNIGAEYYALASKYVDQWVARRGKAEDEVGFALGDLSTPYQLNLFDKIELLQDDVKLCIYAHAAWKNSGFIYGLQPARLLEHFAAAVRLLTDLFMNNTPGARHHAKRYLELILAIFRLRSLGDEGINLKLSLNNKTVRTLYECLESIVVDIQNGRVERELFFSRLNLEITRSSEYTDIPPLLFAVIGCITGETGENDIRISGVDSDDNGDEE